MSSATQRPCVLGVCRHISTETQLHSDLEGSTGTPSELPTGAPTSGAPHPADHAPQLLGAVFELGGACGNGATGCGADAARRPTSG